MGKLRVCIEDGCWYTAIDKKAFCVNHYNPYQERTMFCIKEGCTYTAMTKLGFCSQHYIQHNLDAQAQVVHTCAFDECNLPISHDHAVCDDHYEQLKRNDKLMANAVTNLKKVNSAYALAVDGWAGNWKYETYEIMCSRARVEAVSRLVYIAIGETCDKSEITS